MFTGKEIARDPAAETVHLRWADAQKNKAGALSGEEERMVKWEENERDQQR